ncbi:MAG: hypothetical protein IJA28_04490, partial [Coprobacter sp.]|nr:hypothetical protein [Coprobacter sp.]
MPTKKEQEELLNNCIWSPPSQNGKSGYKIISKINGNSIFLPAAGFFLDGNAQPGNCNYWSSSVKIDSNSSAACLINGESYYEYRNYGQSVRAVFGENNEVGTICSVSASATEGGSATASALEVEQGGSVTLTATPDEGYVFKNWTLGGEVVSTENPYTTTVTANSEYVANFEEIVKYNVTASVNNSDMGSATASASSIDGGGSVTLTATANSGYLFKNWTLGGEVVSTENPYTATITANSEFVANFEEEVSDSGISLTKGYRIKHVESGMYLNVENIEEHTRGTNGGVNCVAYAISNNQIFSFEAVGSNFYLKSKSGYYIYCQDLNVDALSKKTALTFTENEDGSYYILNGSKYFKVEQVNGTYYPFGDAPADLRATWVLEEAIETPPTTAVYNGHEYIDLGLPSGIKWATCNVGATTPEEYGDYFAWGETEPKDFYNWNTYKHCVENGDYYSVNSYCPNSDIGVEDNRTILDAEDDAASANWGGSWRMPTKKEQEELLNNCIWSPPSQNGKSGYKIISKINGNSIFLPAAGFFL